MKRCSKCDRSKHNRCDKGSCECPCQYGDARTQRDDWETRTDPSQDKFFEEMNRQMKEIQDAKKPKIVKQDP